MALTDGIVGCWSPSLGASGYRLLDRSGRGNHGTLTNMDAGTDWVGTPVGLALDYDGTNDYVVSQRGVPVTSATVAVSLWLRRRDTPLAFPRLLDVSDGTQSLQVVLDASVSLGGSNQICTKHTQFQSGVTATQWGYMPDLNAWEHLAISANSTSSTVRLWRNGLEQTGAANTNVGAGTATNTIVFGARRDYNSVTFFDGQMGEVAVWQRSLTTPEIRDLYRRGNGAIGRELTGQTRRRTYGFVAATGARRRRILCGDYS